MASALIDASAMVALFGQREQATARYQDLLQLAALERWALSTTWPCVVEAGYLVPPPNRFALLNWLGKGAVSVLFSSRVSRVAELTVAVLTSAGTSASEVGCSAGSS